MTIDQAIKEWSSKKRRMGCVAASNWLCRHVNGFRPKRLTRYTQKGEVYEHVVATNDLVVIDLAPYSDKWVD